MPAVQFDVGGNVVNAFCGKPIPIHVQCHVLNMNLRIAIFVSTPQTCPLGQGGCISTRRAETHQAKILFVGCDHHQRWIRSQTEVTCFQTVGVWGVIAWMASGVDTPGFIVHSMFNSLFNSGQALLNETPMPLQMSNHIAF